MSQSIPQISTSNLNDAGSNAQYGSQVLDGVSQALNGGLSFADNFKCNSIDVTFQTANVAQSVAHTLNKTGVKYIVVSKNVAADVFSTGNRDTTKAIFLTCTVSSAQVSLVLY